MKFQSNVEHKSLTPRAYGGESESAIDSASFADAIRFQRAQFEQMLKEIGYVVGGKSVLLPNTKGALPRIDDDVVELLDTIAVLKAAKLREGRSTVDASLYRYRATAARSIGCSVDVVDQVTDRRAKQILAK